MKITQTNKTISADFVYIENQYQNETVEISVEFSDDTFNGYVTMMSISNPGHPNQPPYVLPIVNGKVKLPNYTTDFLGLIPISLFGFKGEEVITTNILKFELIASNPTNINIVPKEVDWLQTMESYVDGIVPTITPSIRNGYWYIGETNTGVSATGDIINDTQSSTTTTYSSNKIESVIEEKMSDIDLSTLATKEQVGNLNYKAISQTDYDALTTKNAGTMYFIYEE